MTLREYVDSLRNKTVAVLGVGGYLVYKSRLDSVTLVTFTLYVATFVTPVKRLASFAEQYMLGMAGFSRFCEIMDIRIIREI